MTEVIMPKMGDGMEEGTLLEWLKKDGDKVKSGEVIGTIQTDKATLELEAPGGGTLTGILLEAGGTVPVGKPIAAIVRDGEKLPETWGGSSAPANAPVESQPEKADPKEPEAAGAEFGIEPAHSNGGAPNAPESSSTTANEDDSRIKASPLARKIAAERGVSLSGVKGTGPGGRIVERDVPSAPKAAPTAAVPAQAPAPSQAPVAARGDKVVPQPRLRQITAKRTTESKQQVPHFYVTLEVDVERILALREQFVADESGKISINDFVVKACALALQEMPEVNAVFQGANVLQMGVIHVGIAAAIPEGLTVPVIRDANRLSLAQISAASKSLVQKAKENKLGMDEVSGSTFSISNMGMLDVDNFIAIINQPNAAIVAISSVRRKAVVDESGAIVARSRMNITGSFDHRVVDGALGARFMNVVKSYLERPTRLLV